MEGLLIEEEPVVEPESVTELLGVIASETDWPCGPNVISTGSPLGQNCRYGHCQDGNCRERSFHRVLLQ